MIENTEDNTLTTRELSLHLGPQHPSSHGVLHLVIGLDGERVTSCEPDIGYLHRGTEKIAENLLYHQFVPYTDRLDYMCAMSNNLAYVTAVEKLIGIEIPERAKYIRVIAAELSRIAGHLMGLGAWAVDLGAMSILLYAIREREMVLDIFERLCGARLTLTYLRVGGVRYEFTDGCRDACAELVKTLPGKIDEYETILSGNRIWLERNRGVGIISADEAINLGLSGPPLRASGVNWDIRKDEPYLVYDRLNFDVPTGTNGDSFDRYMVRIIEMRQSVRMIEQCLKEMPGGPFNVEMPEIVPPPKPDVYNNMENLIHHFKYVSSGFKAPVGEIYSAIEAPKGELGVYIVGDGTERPYRLKLRVPSFMNLQSLEHMVKGSYLADVIAVLSSIDPVFGECDK
ncbi:MAG TPA: NADH-quinone oxidoreductase subunit D [Deltaproteobacteria bacterium]|nr:MAG: NADH dehydrogenase [Deltaproteobacteria bacterium GWA2_55_82]OGQ64217.1 MAG: NADH dehydrogenase [Deltaproteobacteria bacterium RIFCSPLOWO2_02_FULL_55_12]OIJ75154.1 MAG: NADH dehydrogenase [Deltaproteobacteria bacterium GWC2_55_46]HBG46424.1 NADH-quinone oxidoreductase subunit D [Deltaproteobacteria bacterium]HCY10636.1 NADH-quinone oxidoreductase subunit D [Deltaproteobacteria bacterium]